MPKKKDWLEIMEEASKLKKGTKIPKGSDIYSMTIMMTPEAIRGQRPQMKPWNTGGGADGVVQPSKPTSLDMSTNPPSVYHEGETVVPFQGGKKIIPAQTEQQQQSLAMTQKKMNLPEYQTGGTVYDDPNDINNNTSTRPTNTLDLSPASNFQSGVNQAFETTQKRAYGTDPIMQNITNRALQDYDTRAAVSDTAARQSVVSKPYLTEGAKTAVGAKQKATYRAGLSGLVGDLSLQNMQRQEQATKDLYSMGRTGVQDEQAKQQWEKSFGEQQYQGDEATRRWNEQFDFEKQKYGDQEFARMADAAQTTSFDTWSQMYPDATEEDYNVAREYIDRQLQAMDVATATASESLNRLIQNGLWEDAQKFLDAQDYEGYAAFVKDNLGYDISPEEYENDLAYNRTVQGLNVEGMTTANKTSEENYNQLVNKGLQDLGDIFLEADDYEGYAEFMKNNFGMDINMAQFEANKAYKNTIQAQTVDANEIANIAAKYGINSTRLADAINAINSGATLTTVNEMLGTEMSGIEFASIAVNYLTEKEKNRIVLEGMENTLGNEEFTSIMDRINSGATLDMINREFPGADLSVEEYMGMKDTTATGQREWERQLSAAGMLIETGDPANLAQAEKALSNLFPGIDFDFDTMINDVGADNFAEGMNALSTLAQTFSSWDEAVQSVVGLDIISDMGLLGDEELYNSRGPNTMAQILKMVVTDESLESINSSLGIDLSDTDYQKLRTAAWNAKQMFEGLQINTLDEEWNAIAESDFFKTLSPEQQDLVYETVAAGVTGELEFDINPVYNVVDEYGNLVKSFDNILDASTYYNENDGEGRGFDVLADTRYVYKNVLTGDTVTVNNGGDVINTGDGGKGGETPATNDAWSFFQESMSSIPEDQWPSYDEWKMAWENAEKPDKWGYDDYLNVKGETTGVVAESLAEKYKNGWPPIKTRDANEAGNYLPETGNELVLNSIDVARDRFIATPENITQVNGDTAVSVFKNISDQAKTMDRTPEGVENYLAGNILYVEGYDAPFIMADPNEVYMSVQEDPNTSIDSMLLVSLKDGELIRLNQDGTVRNDPYKTPGT